jgi:hypothetical protein
MGVFYARRTLGASDPSRSVDQYKAATGCALDHP